MSLMDEQQQHAMEEVAQNFSEALIASYRISSRRDLGPQQVDPELTQRFCHAVLGYLDARAAHIFAASQEQLEQTRKQTRSDQGPAERPEQQASVGAYMDFLNSMLAYYMRGDDSMTASYQWSEEAVERGLQTSQEQQENLTSENTL
jgi:hypothetical protein